MLWNFSGDSLTEIMLEILIVKYILLIIKYFEELFLLAIFSFTC